MRAAFAGGVRAGSGLTVLAALLAWLCLLGTSLAQTLTFPLLTGRVVDQSGLLSPADQAALTSQSAALEAKTGAQLVIVTLTSLGGTAIEDYGYQLGRRWGIGQKGKNTGVLLIVAPAEHAVRIEVGYGLEGTLTDAATKIIIETVILPRFKAGDFPGGIKAGASQIVGLLTADAAAMPRPDQAAVPDAQPVFPLIVAGLAAVLLLIYCAVHGGGLCQVLFQILYMFMASGGRGGSDRGDQSFSGGGGSFGGGGSSGKW